jgi:hypothetical protein
MGREQLLTAFSIRDTLDKRSCASRKQIAYNRINTHSTGTCLIATRLVIDVDALRSAARGKFAEGAE